MQNPSTQLTGGVYPLEEPAELSEISVSSWEVHEVQLPGRAERTRHVVGLRGRHREGVVSSAITGVDAAAHRLTTESGRTYVVTGDTGGNLDSDYVWNCWRAKCRVTDTTDVTAQVKQSLTVSVMRWELTERPHPKGLGRKILHARGTVQGTNAAYTCDIARFNRTKMEGIDTAGRYFKLEGPARRD